MKCALCGEEAGAFGNNPEPLGEWEARVCGQCNNRLVIPARMGAFSDAQVKALRVLTKREDVEL